MWLLVFSASIAFNMEGWFVGIPNLLMLVLLFILFTMKKNKIVGGLFFMQKIIRKYKRGQGSGKSTNKVLDELTLDEMFDKFMTFKKTEALAPRTLSEYYIHFDYLKDFLGDNMTNESITLEDFRAYIGYMLLDKELAPMTVNIRIRTIRAFIRFCYTEGYIDTPIHENLKPVKASEDTLESFTPADIKKLLAVIDDELYTGFLDKVIIFVLLDTLVRISELVAIKRSNVDLKGGFIQLEAGDNKTRKARTVLLSSKTIKLLKEYMKETDWRKRQAHKGGLRKLQFF
jgi:integrase/recombinase XerD